MTPKVTKNRTHLKFRINMNGLTDTLYKLNVNDMRIEGDSCYFCGNVVVDRWNTHTAITGGYQSVNDNNTTIVTQLQDKTTLSPTEPFPITCFMGGLASYNAVGSLDAEKEEYDWSTVYMESDLTGTVHIYNAIAVEYENPCYKLNLHLQE